jgi:hypothetical protein
LKCSDRSGELLVPEFFGCNSDQDLHIFEISPLLFGYYEGTMSGESGCRDILLAGFTSGFRDGINRAHHNRGRQSTGAELPGCVEISGVRLI